VLRKQHGLRRMAPRPRISADDAPEHDAPRSFEWLRGLSLPGDELEYSGYLASNAQPSPRSERGTPLHVSSSSTGGRQRAQQITHTPPANDGSHDGTRYSDGSTNVNSTGPSAGGYRATPVTASVHGEPRHVSKSLHEISLGREPFCLGTTVQMAAVAAKPRTLLAQALSYQLMDDKGATTQIFSKCFAEDFALAVLQVESSQATLTGPVNKTVLRTMHALAAASCRSLEPYDRLSSTQHIKSIFTAPLERANM
jgi:hypothetical protein